MLPINKLKITASTYLLLLITLCALLLAAPANAKQVEAGKVLMATVGVTAQQAGSKARTVARRSSIYEGDTIKTPEGGRAQLLMADGEMISLTASSELKIEAFHYQPEVNDSSKNTNVKNLVTGGLRTITGAVKGDNYEMKSRAGTIGIRGTAFEVYTQQGTNLFVKMQQGNIYVRNAQGSVDIGVNQNLSAARITGLNQAPEAISISDLPQFFEDAFAEDVTLSLAKGGKEKEQKRQPMIFSKSANAAELMQTGLQLEIGKIEQSSEKHESPDYFGFVVGLKSGENIAGQFFDSPISSSGKGGGSTINGSDGKKIFMPHTFNSFELKPSYINNYSIGDSKIFLGRGHDLKTEDGDIKNTSFVFATNIAALEDLPTNQQFTYNLVGSTSLSSGSLSVNFASKNIDVSLSTNGHGFKGDGNISEFYNNVIGLSSGVGGNNDRGSIAGRFVGSGAEGAIGVYQLDYYEDGNSIQKIGTAVFKR